jgi:hypothetical protein
MNFLIFGAGMVAGAAALAGGYFWLLRKRGVNVG